ncbi:G-type lectin S-receptor-like serine/threonine-protein kinase LECRK4 [Tasmannia lanceolata]|uniref:G-type lectin S-receptor-like serine/threonine-protein kinase LECRK4 n=1 Tax=Tasmannia lanceolata TaxID=3420 RepID=UPI004062BB12
MAAVYLFLLFLYTTPLAIAQQTQTNLTLGSFLSPTTNPTSWLSPSNLFAIGFYKQGNGFAVGIWLEADPNKTMVWTANRDDPPVSENATLLLTPDGWLLLKTPGSQDKNITGADQSASSASLLDSGNFLLYNSSSTIIWESFSSPTDTILAGKRLLSGTQMLSSFSDTDHSTGRFRLMMQSDGNLVPYPTYNTDIEDAYWASDTAGIGPNITLILDNLGQLYLANSSDGNILSLGNGISSSNGTIVVYRATLDTDGNFRLYSHIFGGDGSSTMSISWTAVANQCSVYDFCGFNSYCILMDTQPECICLPGFNFSDPIHKFQGCERDFPFVCDANNDNITYSIHSLKNLAWKENTYSFDTILSNSEEGCSYECQRDCECETALFDGQKCMKSGLPLLYGRNVESTNITTLVKVGNGSSMMIDPFSNATNTGNSNNNKSLPRQILITSIVLAAFSIAVFIVSAFLIYKHRVHRYKRLEEAMNFSLTEEIALRFFSYDELLKATDGFKEELGRGAFGTVYKGSLSNGGGRAIAVKRLDKVIEEGEKEFRAETRAIGRTHHRNLVRLLGFCDEGPHRLLVYEYMGSGSLANLIFKDNIRLDWKERVRIAIDVARGILYLHEDCEPHIIHCDIKPQNILMDALWTAKISDFGLAKLLMPNQTKTFTQIRGTRGYVAPEWHRNRPISVKADVYSFGIVLLEIVCCRRNLDLNAADEQIVLCEWVYSCFLDGELRKILGGEGVEEATLERMVKVGLWCIQDEPHLRPSMKTVVLMLEGNRDVPIPPSLSVSVSLSS